MLPTSIAGLRQSNASAQNNAADQQSLVMLSLLRDRYEQLTPRERNVYDVVLSLVDRIPKADTSTLSTIASATVDDNGLTRLLEYVRSGSEELRKYIKYGQALLAVYRLVKRGIVPDPQIVEYLKDNLNPDLAKSLALSQNSRISSPTSTSSHINQYPISTWSRASLAQKIMRDTSNKYNRLVNTNNGNLAAIASPGGLIANNGLCNQQVNFAMRLENLRVLQTILSKKFLKHSLRSPEQIYNFIVSNDTVGTLSAIASSIMRGPNDAMSSATSGRDHFSMMTALNSLFQDRKEDVLVKLSTLMSDPCSRLLKNGQLQLPDPQFRFVSGQDVPIYNALSHFRRHKFPAGRLRLAKTICLKDDISENGRVWIDHRIAKRHSYFAIAKQASTRISNRELKRQQEMEREQRERMKALRERNMDAYMALVKNVKNQRIQEILENTEKLLSDIGAKIQVERNQNEERRKQDALKAEERQAKRKKSSKTSGATPAPPASESIAPPSEAPTPAGVQPPLTDLPPGQPQCLVGGRLMPYQLAGLDFLMSLYNNNLSGILADEMGLGKTIQTISLIAYLYEMKNNPGPHLIAVPLSTLPNWSSEFEKWCPSLKVLQYRGNKIDRRDLNFEVKRCRYNVLLTTFEYILRERKILGSVKWRFIIVDEGHKMKNVKSKFHSTLGEFKSTHRLLLTGTPLQNNLNELWSLLNFLMPHTFSSGEDFERWFEEPFREQFGTPTAVGTSSSNAASNTATALTEEEKLIVINRLHLVLRPFLLRRVKADVLHDLPSKREFVIRVPLSSWQKLLYRQILNKSLKVKDSSSGKITQKSISNTIMQLRKAVNHPYLFLDMYNIDENLYKVSGKFEILDRILTKLLKFRHKILIFSQMTSLMDILADYFEFRGLKYYRLDGSITLQERQDIMAKFNQGGADDVNIFMLSTRAGGLGLNLQSGDTVILFDSDWNPHADLQAQARVHRVGQKREVLVLRFITDSPVEEMILAKAQYKLSIDQQIIQAGMFSNQFNEDEREQNLRQLLSQKDTHGNTTLTTPPELVKYIARSKDEATAFADMDRELFGNEIYDQWPVADEKDAEDSSDNVQAVPTSLQKEQVKRDNDLVRELLEEAGRLCKEENIPNDVREINASDHEDSQQKTAAMMEDNTRGVRKSRLRAQHLIKDEQELFNDIDQSLEVEAAQDGAPRSSDDDDDDVDDNDDGDDDDDDDDDDAAEEDECSTPPHPPAPEENEQGVAIKEEDDQPARNNKRTRRRELPGKTIKAPSSHDQQSGSVGLKRKGEQRPSSNVGSRSAKKRKLA